MLRVTATFIVFLLAGVPGASLACDLWCVTSAETHRQAGCDHAGATDTGSIVAASPCDETGAARLFLTESRTWRVAGWVPVAADVTHIYCAYVPDITSDPWLVFNASSAPPSIQHTVLRL